MIMGNETVTKRSNNYSLGWTLCKTDNQKKASQFYAFFA